MLTRCKKQGEKGMAGEGKEKKKGEMEERWGEEREVVPCLSNSTLTT